MSDVRLFLSDDFELQLPAGFVDKSAQLLEWQVDGGLVALSVQRDVSPTRLRAAQLADKLRGEYERRLSDRVDEAFPLESLSPGLDVVALAMRWRRDGKSVFQVQAFVEHVDRLLILTASGEARLRESITALMLAALDGLELREPDA